MDVPGVYRLYPCPSHVIQSKLRYSEPSRGMKDVGAGTEEAPLHRYLLPV